MTRSIQDCITLFDHAELGQQLAYFVLASLLIPITRVFHSEQAANVAKHIVFSTDCRCKFHNLATLKRTEILAHAFLTVIVCE